MKRTIIAYLFAILGISTIWANDGVYYTSGNFLVPTRETDISVVKEILTITIGKDSMARVDVYYELMNNSQPKTVTMAFEAEASHNVGDPVNRKGIHPFIKDFTVVMNGRRLANRNAVVAAHWGDKLHRNDFVPLDMSKWKGMGEAPDSLVPYEISLYNAEQGRAIEYAYAYCFDAPFKEGLNIVHHTYSYQMSYSHGARFDIPYWLTPAIRWANRQVDDFAFKVTADEPTEFCFTDSLFRNVAFTKTLPSQGFLYDMTTQEGEPLLFAQVCQGDTVTWHGHNFRPTDDIDIISPPWDASNLYYTFRKEEKVVVDRQGNVGRYLGDCGDSYLVKDRNYRLVRRSEGRIEEYHAEKGDGFLVANGETERRRIKVRMRPNENSKVMGTIVYRPDKILEVFPCLGYTDEDHDGFWFKVKVGGKVGYVAEQFMRWDSVNTF